LRPAMRAIASRTARPNPKRRGPENHPPPDKAVHPGGSKFNAKPGSDLGANLQGIPRKHFVNLA